MHIPINDCQSHVIYPKSYFVSYVSLQSSGSLLIKWTSFILSSNYAVHIWQVNDK